MAKIKALTVNPNDYREFIKARAKAAAAVRKVEFWRGELNMPKATYQTRGQYILVDDQRNLIGKFTVSRSKEYTVRAGWRANIS